MSDSGVAFLYIQNVGHAGLFVGGTTDIFIYLMPLYFIFRVCLIDVDFL